MGTLISSDINTIYNDYSPAFDNLYTVEIFPLKGEKDTLPLRDYIKFHATNVDFNGESLNLERNGVTKNFQLSSEGYTRADTLGITWRESDDWRVKKYHDEWLGNFYNKEKDHYWSYPIRERDRDNNRVSTRKKDSLYRQFVVTLPYNSDLGSRICTKVIFDYVLPHSAPGFKLGWKSQGGVVSHSLDYYVTKWKIETVIETVGNN